MVVGLVRQCITLLIVRLIMEVVIMEEDIMEGRVMVEEDTMVAITISTSITTSISIITTTIFIGLITGLEITIISVPEYQPVRLIQKIIGRGIITGLRTAREIPMQ